MHSARASSAHVRTSHVRHPRAWQLAAMVVGSVVVAACSDPVSTRDAAVGLEPVAPSFSYSGGSRVFGQAKVCVDNGGVPAGSSFQFDVTGGASPATVNAGQCKVVATS